MVGMLVSINMNFLARILVKAGLTTLNNFVEKIVEKQKKDIFRIFFKARLSFPVSTGQYWSELVRI